MCFSATANFVGSGVLGAVGVVTFTKVKHRRELLFAALPTLFAVHHFVGADSISVAAVRHKQQHRVHQSSDQQHYRCIALCDCNLWLVVFLEDQDDGNFRRGKPGDTDCGNGGQKVRVYLTVV